ncbi:MAG: (4Fe-4S)-binding protein [Gammaproteobacteria bacterium]|nr:MAG: (4Fe-4S)-binding protein [Gammaproteobacteria bacterium]RLA43610.1 MAG: (4Fe-4S)-binding protein [Gammaproteobacteria bacterium]
MNNTVHKPFFAWKHLNKLRWLSLATVFAMLILIPFLHVYQTFIAAHTYDLLSYSEKQIYDTMSAITSPFVSDPEEQLDALKGNTWSGTVGSLKLSDPLAVIGQIVGSRAFYWPFILTALIPVLFTVLLGRFFCGWICPATFLYELNSNLAILLRKSGLRIGNKRFDRRLKYLVLAIGLVVAVATGSVVFAAIYPPAVIGREIYYAIALGGFGSGVVYFLLTLLFDLLVSRRGFCRYLCPGGALYSLLGRFRLLRIKRIVEGCNDCAKCTAVCEFGLDPLHDQFGQECNNCTACISVCPTDAMTFYINPQDIARQGPGHLGRKYKQQKHEQGPDTSVDLTDGK